MGNPDFIQLLVLLVASAVVILLVSYRAFITDCRASCQVQPYHTRYILVVVTLLALVSLLLVYRRRSRLYRTQQPAEHGIVTQQGNVNSVYTHNMAYFLVKYAADIGVIIFGTGTVVGHVYNLAIAWQCSPYLADTHYRTIDNSTVVNITHQNDNEEIQYGGLSDGISFIIHNSVSTAFLVWQIPFLCRMRYYESLRERNWVHHTIILVIVTNIGQWIYDFLIESRLLFLYGDQSAHDAVAVYGESLENACFTHRTILNSFKRSTLHAVTYPLSLEFALAAMEILIQLWLLPWQSDQPEADEELVFVEDPQGLDGAVRFHVSCGSSQEVQVHEPSAPNVPTITEQRTNAAATSGNTRIHMDYQRQIEPSESSEQTITNLPFENGLKTDDGSKSGGNAKSVIQISDTSESSEPLISRSADDIVPGSTTIRHEYGEQTGTELEGFVLPCSTGRSYMFTSPRQQIDDSSCYTRFYIILMRQVNVYAALVIGLLDFLILLIYILHMDTNTNPRKEIYFPPGGFESSIEVPTALFANLTALFIVLVSLHCVLVLRTFPVSRTIIRLQTSDVVVVFAIMSLFVLSVFDIASFIQQAFDPSYGSLKALSSNFVTGDVPYCVQYVLQAVIMYLGRTRKANVNHSYYATIQQNLSFLAMVNVIIWSKNSFLLPQYNHEDIHAQYISPILTDLFQPPCIYFRFISIFILLKAKNRLRDDEIRYWALQRMRTNNLTG